MLKKLLLLAISLVAIEAIGATKPIKVIFDTDMGNDVDDVLALDMLYKYHDEGTIDLLGIVSSKREMGSVKFIDAMNTLYGHPNIPIGIAKIYPEDNYVDPTTRDRLNFADYTVAKYNYAYTTKEWEGLPDGYKLMRELLAKAKNKSVVIVAVGFSTNMARLFDSEGDEYSPLGGKELFAKKVSKVVIMAGHFSRDKAEYNIRHDLSAAIKFINECPVPMYFTDFLLGASVHYPWQAVYQGYKYCENHPLVVSFEYYREMPHNRPLWDPTAVLFAAEPEGGYAMVSKPGVVEIDSRGVTKFVEKRGGNRYIYSVDDSQRKKIVDRVVELTLRNPYNHNK